MSDRFKLWVTADPRMHDLSVLAMKTERMRKARVLAEYAGLDNLYDPDLDGDLALMVLADDLSSLISLATQLVQYHDLTIDQFEPNAQGEVIEAKSVVDWLEYLRTGVKRRVHVVSFSPATDEVGVGGFDWYPRLEDAKASMAQRLTEETEEGGLYNLALVHVDVPAIMTRDEVTRLLDENLEWFEPAGMLRGYTEAAA